MIRTLYSALWYLITPLLHLYFYRLSRKQPDYRFHLGERFGTPHPNPVHGAIWVHAVADGETRAAAPLIAALRQHFPDAPLLLTQMIPSGRATAKNLYPDAQCRYIPFDRPDWVAQFITEHRPRFGIIMETEIWPNLMHACRDAGIPLFLANARLSERSAQGYRRVRRLIAPVLSSLRGCFAQTEADAQRLQDIGAPKPHVCGNTKYDITPPTAAAELAHTFRQLIGTRPVLLAASTRVYRGTDEARLIMQAWQAADKPDNALLIIVPRYPEHFQTVADTAAEYGIPLQRRSSGEALSADTQIWLGDSMGELFAYYHCADVCFVGGSLVDSGCQNIIEPLSCGKPVLFGTSTYNFQSACSGALAAQAAVQVHSADELVHTALGYLHHPESHQAFSRNALAFTRQHQGASERIARLISQSL